MPCVAEGLDFGLIDPGMPRSAREAVIVAGYLADPLGVVPDGLPSVHRALGHAKVGSTAQAVREAEAWRYLVRHIKRPKPTDIRVILHRLREGLCIECGQESPPLGPAPQKRCPKCRRALDKARSWREEVLAIVDLGRSQGLTEPQILYRAHMRTGVRLYGSTDAEVTEDGQAIAPWLVSMGLIHPRWLVYAEKAMGRRTHERGTKKLSQSGHALRSTYEEGDDL
jgi:hypothetical protein